MLKCTLMNMCMVYDLATNRVLVQDKVHSRWAGITFPGGHINDGESIYDSAVREVKEETGLTISNLEQASESIYDCAVREVKEETGLDVNSLKYCGVVHWVHRENDERYLCFMYKTTQYDGKLIAKTDEGEQFWLGIDELFTTPKEKFSTPHYALSPLFQEYGRYSEVFLTWVSSDESTWELCYQ